MSADGSVVVGRSEVQIDEFITASQAYRWTAASGAVPLGTLDGDYSSDARAVSADGNVVVGSSAGRAFRWAQTTGMVDIGPGEALDVSADGSIVIGWTVSDSPYSNPEAFYWTEQRGMRYLSDVLEHRGLDLSGRELERATTISTDGQTIVGIVTVQRAENSGK